MMWRTVRPMLLSAVLIVTAMSLFGCGYALVGTASNLPEDIREIYVEPLENATARTQLGQILTQALADELVLRRRFDVVNSPDSADALLRGTVIGFRVRPVTYNAEGLATNFEIEITANMRFQRVPAIGQPEEEAEVIWANARYLFRRDYPVEDAGLDFVERETEAIEETAEEFAETLIIDLLEGF
ncbi:MAG: LPS assembly lipoprotein LptE [Acidobacteriota bacterium]